MPSRIKHKATMKWLWLYAAFTRLRYQLTQAYEWLFLRRMRDDIDLTTRSFWAFRNDSTHRVRALEKNYDELRFKVEQLSESVRKLSMESAFHDIRKRGEKL